MRWSERTHPELAGLASGPTVAILPLGAVEAHGPHLPVGADLWIAEAMARDAVRRLAAEGVTVALLPAMPYAPAPFAADFPGTLSIRANTLVALLLDLAEALARREVAVLALANAHFDPEHVGALHNAVARIVERGRPRVAFPDLTRRELATRLTAEFASGACHGGCFETSILLAERPELVDEAARTRLEPLPVSLSAAIRAGRTSFLDAGLHAAYCGDPAAASASEGQTTVALLGEILAESVRQALAGATEPPP